GRVLNGNTFHLEQNFSRTDNCDPVIRRAFALSHTGFGRLLGDRLVGKQANLDLAAALDETRHSNTGPFNLAVGDPTRFENFQTEIAESQLAAAPGFSTHATALLLAVLNFLWHQHKFALSF